jgi:hypothetical protein
VSSASLWALLPVLSFGQLAPIPIIHAAIRLRTWTLWAASALYTAATIVLWSTWPVSSGSAVPDLPRQFDDGGLVDLNHVPTPVIVQLLGLSEAEAAQVIGARDHIGGFISAEEVIVRTDLSPTRIDSIRERLVFLPLTPA